MDRAVRNNGKTIIFHHIPKSGGTYVLRVIKNGDNGRHVRIGIAEGRAGKPLAWRDVNSSHVAFAAVEPGPGDFFFTWVRDPVAMASSAFSYYRTYPRAAKTALQSHDTQQAIQVRRIVQANSFEDYIDEALAESFPIYPYGQFTLDWSQFDFVGIAESMENSLNALSVKSGMKLHMRPAKRVNETGSRLPDGFREEMIRRKLLSLECEIYQKLRSGKIDIREITQ